jgi:signal transduction histidine kinase
MKKINSSSLDSLSYITTHDLKSSIDDLEFSFHALEQFVNFYDNETLTDLYNIIQHAINKERNIINGMSDFIEMKQVDKYEPTEFNPINEIKMFFEQDILKHNIIIEDNDTMIEASKGLFLILIKNLVSNALKYNHTSPKKILIYKEKDFIVIEDNGDGLDVANINNLFKPFIRGNHPEIYGTGLGLAIVKEIAEMHQWHISVKSKLNIGTTFKISIYANISD